MSANSESYEFATHLAAVAPKAVYPFMPGSQVIDVVLRPFSELCGNARVSNGLWQQADEINREAYRATIGVEAPGREAARRTLPALERAQEALIQSAALHLAKGGQIDDLRSIIRFRHLPSDIERPVVAGLFAHIDAIAADYVAVEKIGREVQSVAVAYAEQGLEYKYELLKLVSEPDPESAKESEALTLTAILQYVKAPLITELHELLTQGAFDALIAKDVLSAAADSSNEQLPNGLAKVAELVAFATRLLTAGMTQLQPDAADRIQPTQDSIHTLLCSMLGDIPQMYKSALDGYKRQLTQALDFSLRINRNKLIDVGLGDNDGDHLEATRVALANMTAIVTTQTQKRRHVRRGELETARFGIKPEERAAIMKGRRRNAVDGKSTDDKPASDTVIETQIRQPRSFVKINSRGTIYDTDTPEYSALTEDFMRVHGHGNTALRTDIEHILEHLSLLDFGSGQHLGTKTLYRTLKVDGKDLSMFEFKPAEAKGCSTKTKLAKALRVLFVHVDTETIGLLEIVDRKDIKAVIDRYTGNR